MSDPNYEVDDGAGEPPWLPEVGHWFVAAAVLLVLPRLWAPAAGSLAIGLGLSFAAARRARR